MTKPPDPTLYSFRRCPFAMRARLALAVSGTRVELREVKLSEKPAAMLAVSAKGTVPVLVLPDGQVIDESLAIMRWALTNHDPERWLERDDDALIAANDGPFKQDLDRYKYPQQYDVDPLIYRERGLNFLREIDVVVLPGDQLGGGVRGLNDAAIVPFVRQFAAIDRRWFDALALPRLQAWLDDYVKSELFQMIMRPVAIWVPVGSPQAAQS